MDLGNLRASIKDKKKDISPSQKSDPKTIKKSKEGVDTTESTSQITGWEVLMSGFGTIKKILVVAVIIVFTYLSGRYIAWYAPIAFWIDFFVFYAVFRYVIKIPVVALIEYDYEEKSGNIWAITTGMWNDIDKEGVSAHIRMGGRPVYVAKSFDPKNMKIDFAWIHHSTFLDFWEDDTTFGLISEKLQEVYERYLEAITLKEVLAREKAGEYVQLGKDFEES